MRNPRYTEASTLRSRCQTTATQEQEGRSGNRSVEPEARMKLACSLSQEEISQVKYWLRGFSGRDIVPAAVANTLEGNQRESGFG